MHLGVESAAAEELVVRAFLRQVPFVEDVNAVGVPDAGRYEVVFDSDHPGFGGSGFGGASYEAFGHTVHGFPFAIRMRLPPLAGVFLKRAGG